MFASHNTAFLGSRDNVLCIFIVSDFFLNIHFPLAGVVMLKGMLLKCFI